MRQMSQLQWVQQITVGPANYSGSSKLQWVQQITVSPANYSGSSKLQWVQQITVGPANYSGSSKLRCCVQQIIVSSKILYPHWLLIYTCSILLKVVITPYTINFPCSGTASKYI